MPPTVSNKNIHLGGSVHQSLNAAIPLQPFYDAERIEKILSFHTLRHEFGLWLEAVRRFFTIIGFFIEVIWMIWWDHQIWSYIGEADIDRAQSLRRHYHGKKITSRLLDLGPTFIKVGQSLSTRVDLLRKEYIEELCKLQDQVPSFPTDMVCTIIEKELGDRVENIFQSFDSEPLAAASLGQVHKAVLKDGQEVVIKVQRPNLIRMFEIDLAILKHSARMLQNNSELGRGREWVFIVDEFGKTLFEEIDYIKEGRNADRFRCNLDKWSNLLIPKVHWKYTSHRVITMDYLSGIKINDLAALDEAGLSRSDIATSLVKIYFQQILVDGFFHADPHPGNIVVTKQGKLILYDFGMVGSIHEDTRFKIVSAFLNIVNKRTDAILNNLTDLEMVTPGADMEEIRTIVDWALTNYYDIPHDQLNFEDLADEMAEVMYYYPFKLPASFTFMFRALITLEGVATGLYPQIQFMSLAIDYAREFVQKAPLLEQAISLGGKDNYLNLLKGGLDLLGFSSKSRIVSPSRVRLNYDEWKPIARYVKAGFLILSIGQTSMVVLLMTIILIAIKRFAPEDLAFAVVLMVMFLMIYILITFGTLLLLPSRKKPILFSPPPSSATKPSVNRFNF